MTSAEFAAYYAGVSAMTPSDDDFVAALRAVWGLDQHTVEEFIEPVPLPQRSVDASKRKFQPQASSSSAHHGTVDPDFVIPRRIVGYTGHIPTAQERFGETYHRIEITSQPLVKKEKDWSEGTFVDEGNAIVRRGNKANRHNFKLA